MCRLRICGLFVPIGQVKTKLSIAKSEAFFRHNNQQHKHKLPSIFHNILMNIA